MTIVDLFKLEGRKALVTGAGRGIGRVLAISLAEAGCDIGIFEKNIDDAQNVVGEIKKQGKKAYAFQGDVTKKDDVEKAFAALAKQLGGLDIVINNAGVCIHEAAETTPEEHLDFVVDTDLERRVLLLSGGLENHDSEKERQHHQYRLDVRHGRQLSAETGALQCGESRCDSVNQMPGRRMGRLWHPRQFHQPRLYPD